MSHSRKLPHSSELERSLLGGLLLDPSQLADTAEAITASDFHRPQHQHLFALLTELAHLGGYDLQVVLDALAQRPHPEIYGGITYVVGLPNQCASVESVSMYAAKVRDLSVRRRLLLSAWATIDAAADASVETDQLINDATARLTAVSATTRTGVAWAHIAGIAADLAAELEERDRKFREAAASGKPSVVGITTGFADLDRITQGLHPTDLIVVAARPAMGKTAYAMGKAVAAARTGVTVGVFSMEMSAKQLVQRMLAVEALVDAGRLRSGDLDESQHWPRIQDGIEALAKLPIHFDETGGLTFAQLRARALRLKAERPNLGLLIIDYLQLMNGDRGELREQAIAGISRGLKLLAKELKIPIVVLSQLNRNLESRTDKRPIMSDLKESSAIEQDADVILFIYRDEVYNADSADKGLAEIIIGKQRSGAIGTVKLAFIGTYTKFANYASPVAYDRDYQ